jgi:hypothetical protein
LNQDITRFFLDMDGRREIKFPRALTLATERQEVFPGLIEFLNAGIAHIGYIDIPFDVYIDAADAVEKVILIVGPADLQFLLEIELEIAKEGRVGIPDDLDAIHGFDFAFPWGLID